MQIKKEKKTVAFFDDMKHHKIERLYHYNYHDAMRWCEIAKLIFPKLLLHTDLRRTVEYHLLLLPHLWQKSEHCISELMR